MKKLFFITILSLSVLSCEKTYQCTATSVTEGFSDVSVSYEFKGTKEEAKQAEKDGSISFGDITTTTVCR